MKVQASVTRHDLWIQAPQAAWPHAASHREVLLSSCRTNTLFRSSKREVTFKGGGGRPQHTHPLRPAKLQVTSLGGPEGTYVVGSPRRRSALYCALRTLPAGPGFTELTESAANPSRFISAGRVPPGLKLDGEKREQRDMPGRRERVSDTLAV